MKRFAVVALTALTLFSAVAVAGEGHAKKCKGDTQACLDKMTASLAAGAWDGIWVHSIKPGEDVVVRQVDADSPGAKAGIQEGDVLAAMNDVKLRDLDAKAFHQAMAGVKIGEEVVYAVNRNGSWLKVPVTMVATPKDEAAKQIGRHMLYGHAKMEGDKVAAN